MKAEKITKEHFEKALKKVPSSITKEIEEMYQNLKDKFSTARAKEMERDKPGYFG